MERLSPLVPMALVATLLGACSGSESPSRPGDQPAASASTTTPPPREYTREQLVAAMPTPADVPGGTQYRQDCRTGAGEGCAGGNARFVAIAGDTNVTVSVAVADDEAAARRSLQRGRQRLAAFDGAFDVARKQLDARSYTPRQVGTGRLTDEVRGPWRGHRLVKRFWSDEPTNQLRQTDFLLRSAKAELTVVVIAGTSQGSDAEFTRLSDRVLDEYLERLG